MPCQSDFITIIQFALHGPIETDDIELYLMLLCQSYSQMTKIGPWNATINALPAVYMYAKVKCSAGKGFRERGVELSSLVTHYYEPTVLHYILAVVITTARYIHVHEKAFCKGGIIMQPDLWLLQAVSLLIT